MKHHIWFFLTSTMFLHPVKPGSIPDDEGSDCALDAASTCFQPLTKLFNCSILSAPACEPGALVLTRKNLELICSSLDEALNGCLVDLLGSSCLVTDPKHSHLRQWLKPLNILLKEICSPESMSIMAESVGCEDERIFKCLFSSSRQFNLIELLTTEIPPELCGNIELRAQFCLASTVGFQLQCKPILRLFKELTQDFVDNTPCVVEPVILVPLHKPPTTIQPPSAVEESDRTCELDPIVLSACFEPMMNDWKCYFSSESDLCQFSLDSLCASTLEAFESCAGNLIGYGCANNKTLQREYYKWTLALGDVQDELCGGELTQTEAQSYYFDGKVSCWMEFFTCLHSLQNQKQLLTLITHEINGEVCREVADNVDYCLMTLSFSEHFHDCDLILDKIQGMKNAFTASAPCINSTAFLISDEFTLNKGQINMVHWYVIVGFFETFQILFNVNLF